MVDSENGVESYKYQIFDTRTMDAGTGSPMNVIEKIMIAHTLRGNYDLLQR